MFIMYLYVWCAVTVSIKRGAYCISRKKQVEPQTLWPISSL